MILHFTYDMEGCKDFGLMVLDYRSVLFCNQECGRLKGKKQKTRLINLYFNVLLKSTIDKWKIPVGKEKEKLELALGLETQTLNP